MRGEITALLGRVKAGDRSALDELVPLVYHELHKVADHYLRQERPNHTLQPTALINEVYLQLVGKDHPDYEDRVHFFGIAAFHMRQILAAHARKRLTEKRGGGIEAIPLDPMLDFSPERASTVVALDDALTTLAGIDVEQARMVELRFYSGMTADEIALLTGNSVHRVRHRLRIALGLAASRSGQFVSPEIQRLFEDACKLPAARQERYLESQTDDAAVRDEVLSLLAHDALGESFFADALRSATSSIKSSMDLVLGSRVGAFTIVRMVGRGGMGAVYLATRADGVFHQSVAIKVIDSNSALLRARFQQEREILASLNHPNIARLLDGGETPSGLPYLVMEFVPGEQIDAYCDQQGLDLRARLALFLQVAAAVQHAHRRLIVHRDLKPGNILIGEDGTPKLLDFGIAKVLDTSPEAKVSTRVMTLEYASPEQVRGGEITTASDIYSLGAVLYRLLTGRPPHSTEGLSPLDTARQIAEQAVPRAANVPVDVAAILEKALHNDPSHRYRSVDDLCDEIHRFLEGKAVLAVQDLFAYRTVKFLRRHWIPVTAMAAVLLALTLGTGVSLWQARKAERRFAEVRQLSNRFLFEFEGTIHSVPGATKARHLVVKTAQEYLDRLAAEGGSGLFGRRDPALIHELAEAYRKLGDVQGNPVDSNAGDSRAALASYRKALALRESVEDETASDTQVRVGYLDAITSAANAEAVSGDAARARRLHEKAVAVAESWVKKGSDDADLLNAVANAYSQLSVRKREVGSYDSALSNAKHALELRQQALALSRATPNCNAPWPLPIRPLPRRKRLQADPRGRCRFHHHRGITAANRRGGSGKRTDSAGSVGRLLVVSKFAP